MNPNSIDTPAIFCERRPDWSRGVELEIVNQTRVFTSRSGLEQRARTRPRPIYRLGFSESGLEASELRNRRRRAAVEMALPIWVPFWCERALTTHATTVGEVRIDRTPSADWFAEGQKLLISDGTTNEFRDIEAVSGRVLSTSDGTVWPVGSRVYAVRLCRRLPGNDAFAGKAIESAVETLQFETI